MQVRQAAILRRVTWMWSAGALACVRCGFCEVVSRESFARRRGHLHPTARSAHRDPGGCGPWVPKRSAALLLAPLQTGHDFVFPNDVVRIDGSKADLPLARGARLADPDDFVGGAP